MVAVVVVAVVAVVAIAAVAIVLGRVVVRRVSWRRGSGSRIQTNDTAAIFVAVISKHDGPADDTILAAKVLHPRCLCPLI